MHDVATLPLPQRLFLLSHHPAKSRLDDDSAAVRGSLLRAAAVADLRIAGLLYDRNGKAERTTAAVTDGLDPFLAAVLGDVTPGRPHDWFKLVHQRSHQAEEAVRDRLVAATIVTVGYSRIRSLIGTQRISVPDPGPVEALRGRVRDAAMQGAEPGPLPLGEVVLAWLAIDGNVSTVFGWRDLWGHKPAVRALSDRIDRDLPGFRPAVTASIAVSRSPA